MVTTLWPPAPQHVDEAAAATRVELAHDVVEQQQRRRGARLRERLALGQQEREQAQALLPARAVGAQVAALAAEDEVVAVRAMAGEAALEVGRDPLGQLGGERLRGRGPRARPVGDRRATPSSPRPAAWAAKRGARSSATAARSSISAMPWRASSASHAGREAAPRAAGADRGDERVALGERGRVGAAGRGAGRAQGGDDLVEMRAPQRRRTRHELQPVGQEDGHQRAGARRR